MQGIFLSLWDNYTFFRYFYLNLLKMQIPTGNSEDCLLLFQLVWRLSEFEFLVRFTSVAALFILYYGEKNMKRTLSLLLALVLMFSMCISLISCANSNNPSGDNPSTSNPFNVDLAGYVANIGNATALGISKKAKASATPMASCGTNNFGVQLLSYSTLSSDKDAEDKNYIVMSTTDYDANAPEADKTGLTKVTFTKIVTENVTTETTGTKYILANEGSISISATEGFKYTVYYNDSLVYNEVQDNDSNDEDSKIGVIVLDNLIDGMEYEVNYRGIGVETTITQDDIEAEIDKL